MILRKIRRKIEKIQERRAFDKQLKQFKSDMLSNNFKANMGEATPKAAAIILSYARPSNIPWIVRALLHCDFVSKVVVSNNNPDMKMEDWFDFQDPRLELVNQPERRRAGYRYEIARHMEEENFIFIDDDLYLYPSQIQQLYTSLLEQPERPHGIWGQHVYREPEDKLVMSNGIRKEERELEVMNRAYFLTAEHVSNFFVRLHSLGKEKITDLKFGDDIILSFSGKSKPWCHDIGEIFECWSNNAEGIALWQENNFFDYREELYRTIEANFPRDEEERQRAAAKAA